MNSLDKSIIEFLNKVSKRIKADFLLNLSIVGLKLLLCLSFTLLIISLLITFPYVEEVIAVIIIVGLIITIIFGIINAPDKKKVAITVDSKGLSERMITSLELIGVEDNVAIIQKQDTLKELEDFDIKKNFKINIDKRQSLICLGLIVMCILTVFVPSTAKEKANEIRSFNKLQKEWILKIEKEKEEIDKVEEFSKTEKDDIEKILDDALKEINESEKKSEVDKVLERLEKKLDNKKETMKDEKTMEAIEERKNNLLDNYQQEKREEAKKDLNTLASELNKKEESKALGEAILSGDENEINREIANIEKRLANMSSAELSKLSEALKNSAGDVSELELSEALSNASNSVLDKSIDGQQLSEAISKSLNNSKGNSQGNSSKGNASGQGNAEGQGNNEGSGNNGESGNGSGTGWNTGSINGEEDKSEGKLSEEVFIPGRNEGNDDNLIGSKNESGDRQQIETENGLNESGSMLDYDKVIGDYSNSALEGANNSALPEGLKNIIKDYFEGLN